VASNPIWVNGMDPLDPHKDPDDNLEEARIGQQFWSWESQAAWITIEDLKNATKQNKK